MRRPHLLAGEDLPPPPRQRRSLDRRARIKRAAVDLFSRRGYEATPVGAIARRAALPVGTFYQHFQSKRQLLLVLMDDLLAFLQALDLRPRGSGDPGGALRETLRTAFASDLEHAGVFRAWQEAVLIDRDLARKDRAIRSWTSKRVLAVLRFLSSRPGARRGIDLRTLATILDRFFWSVLTDLGQLSEGQLHRVVNAATHLVYHAMFEDRRPSSAPRRTRRLKRATTQSPRI